MRLVQTHDSVPARNPLQPPDRGSSNESVLGRQEKLDKTHESGHTQSRYTQKTVLGTHPYALHVVDQCLFPLLQEPASPEDAWWWECYQHYIPLPSLY